MHPLDELLSWPEPEKWKDQIIFVRKIIKGISYRDCPMDAVLINSSTGEGEFRIDKEVEDSDGEIPIGNKWYLNAKIPFTLSEMDTEEKILARVFSLIMEMEIHEAAEWFCYNGDRPFHPHKTAFHNWERKEGKWICPEK